MKYIASFKDPNGNLRHGFYASSKKGARAECVCCLLPSAWTHKMPAVVEVARLCR